MHQEDLRTVSSLSKDAFEVLHPDFKAKLTGTASRSSTGPRIPGEKGPKDPNAPKRPMYLAGSDCLRDAVIVESARVA